MPSSRAPTAIAVSAAILLVLARLLVPGALAVSCAPSGQDEVGQQVGHRAGDEAGHGGQQATAAFGLVDQVEGERGDEHTSTEGHHRGDDALRHVAQPGDERAYDQRPACGESPESGLRPDRHVSEKVGDVARRSRSMCLSWRSPCSSSRLVRLARPAAFRLPSGRVACLRSIGVLSLRKSIHAVAHLMEGDRHARSSSPAPSVVRSPVTRRATGDVVRPAPQVLRQYALIADGERGALVGPRGDIAFMCAPSWHDDAVFSSLLGGRGGYGVSPADDRFVWGGYYEPQTLIWRSRWVSTNAVTECREGACLSRRPPPCRAAAPDRGNTRRSPRPRGSGSAGRLRRPDDDRRSQRGRALARSLRRARLPMVRFHPARPPGGRATRPGSRGAGWRVPRPGPGDHAWRAPARLPDPEKLWDRTVRHGRTPLPT